MHSCPSTSEVEISLWKAKNGSVDWVDWMHLPVLVMRKKALCCWLVVSKLISFSPLFVGEGVQICLIFFQMGWNHQLACFVRLKMKTCKTMRFKRKKQKDCICTYQYIYIYIPSTGASTLMDFELQQKSWFEISGYPPWESITYPLPQEPGPAAELETTSFRWNENGGVFERPFLHVGSWYLFFDINSL